MNFFKKSLGRILYFIAQALSFILDVIIGIAEVTVNMVTSINSIFAIIGAGGCFFLLIFSGPFGFFLLLNPVTLFLLFFLFIFPILGTTFISFLKYVKYMFTEFLFDRANYLIYGKKSKYNSFFEYGNKYRKEEAAKKERERQQKREQQQREWEERFRQWQEFQNSQRNTGQGRYEWYGQNNRSYRSNTGAYTNPSTEFIKKYEESCNLLGVNYDADKYQIKLAFRKKAKQYHPDINKNPNATEIFQQINDAYDFLSDENIQRYKKLKGN
ncbi:J domain-containing protein [Garciella nitratireducens]|uniref:J domain-containing protein n=1 Tax=Garciella nitratireducens TaxID=218205 RepID=UPI000DEBC267|nr:DnaJ domain-containing protein [Garciella nitratireducens]RBP41618.1 DnaJ-like protein [Garciella nitratireducens]